MFCASLARTSLGAGIISSVTISPSAFGPRVASATVEKFILRQVQGTAHQETFSLPPGYMGRAAPPVVDPPLDHDGLIALVVRPVFDGDGLLHHELGHPRGGLADGAVLDR